MPTTNRIERAPDATRIAGLRSRLIARLTGLTQAQLQYWHESRLLEATNRLGQRGIPRLYSWADYLRLQIASELAAADVLTPHIREAVTFLDKHFKDWYLLPVYASRGHVLAETVALASPLFASRAGQHILDWPDELAAVGDSAEAALRLVAKRGPLGILRQYADAVTMDPAFNLGQPTVVGTTLETSFVAGMANDIGAESVANIYKIRRTAIKRVVEFEEAVA